MKPLLVIIPDRLSALVKKGEITERYYNPGDLFKEVHILMTNDDQADPGLLQRTVGSAKLFLHNLPAGKTWFLRSLGWRPRLLERWAQGAVDLARRIRPGLVRCHGNNLNAYAAYRIKQALGIPYVVSLHGNPDIDYYRGRLGRTWPEKLLGWAIEAVEAISIKNADHVLPVYSPIIPYLKKHRVDRYTVVYNAVGYGCVPKTSYALDPKNVKCLCVGRQMTLQKDPGPIIDAVAELPNVSLLLIGDGDLHEELVQRAESAGAADRIKFRRSLPNSEILRQLASADIYLYSSINYEISKTCIEAALTGLPVILNDRGGDPAGELKGGHFWLVEGTRESYREALRTLIQDDECRRNLGQAAGRHAREHWAPEKMEAKVVEIYQSILPGPEAVR